MAQMMVMHDGSDDGVAQMPDNGDALMAQMTVITDGSDDGFIHCLKPGGRAHSAEEAITMEIVHFNSKDFNDDDPFPVIARQSLRQTSRNRM